METTTLSSRGQVVIPAAFRASHRWEAGLELAVIDTGDGLLLKPKQPLPASDLTEVAGMLRSKTTPKTDAEIRAALQKDARRKWRGRR